MIRSFLLAAAAAAALSVAPVQAKAPAQSKDAATTLHKLFADEWERGLVESPENASNNGDNRFNDRWSDYSLAAIAKREAEDRAALAKLHAIDRKALTPADQLNYDTFEWQLERAVERQKFHEYLQPVSHQGGVQTADGLAEVLPFASTKDYRDWLKRMEAIPTLVDQSIALMREGDTVFEQDGVRIRVDADSLALVDGTRIDFLKNGLSEQFVFRNPNVAGECGCGESFTTDADRAA